jgi:hypothetical protein
VRLLTVLAITGLLAACGGDGEEEVRADRPSDEPAPPDRAPDSAGPVSAVTDRSVRIDEATGVVGALDARVDGATVVLRRQGDDHEAAALGDIRVGDRVEVWVDGPVAESYPAQAHAEAVVLAG